MPEEKTIILKPMEILVKYGTWAFFAVLFFGVIVLYQLKPAAEAQESLAKDRQYLMEAVTKSLSQNSESMAGMSKAIQTLNDTMRRLDETQHKTQAVLEGFTEAVQNEHKTAQDSLDRIDKNTTPE